MLTVHHLSKSFNLTTLFEDATFSVNPGERVGLIGPNGCGKTTLMRTITGELVADAGTITHANGLRIGYLPQGFELDPDQTLGEVLDRAAGSIDALEDELGTLAVALADSPDDIALQDRYDAILTKISGSGVGNSAEITHALGLDQIDRNLPVHLLSGGQKTRLTLALILLDDPQLLLLDEPTNHLDIAMLEWLENWLERFPGGALIVSHDRTFLDRTVTKVLDLDPEKKRIVEYVGNYSDYLAQWQQARNKARAAWSDQVYEERRLRQDANRERARGEQIHRTTTPRQPGLRKKAKKAMQRATSKEKRLERYTESDERVEKPKQGWQMKVDFAETSHLGRSVLHLENLTVGYDPEKPLLSIPEMYVQSNQRIVLTGENGSGKTTLLRTIVGQLPALNGVARMGGSVRLGYMSQEQELLDMTLSPTETLLRADMGSETDVRNFLHLYLFKGDEPLKPIGQLSFGQRSRLELALLVAQGCNFLVLDEPINHLDIPSRELFEQALLQFNGTTLAVVHDRYFIERFASEIWWVEEGGIRRELKA